MECKAEAAEKLFDTHKCQMLCNFCNSKLRVWFVARLLLSGYMQNAANVSILINYN